jgi:predicted exporter
MENNSNAQIFKITFLTVSVGLISGMLVYQLLSYWMDEKPFTVESIAKVLVTGIFTALILALLNMYLKVYPFKRR